MSLLSCPVEDVRERFVDVGTLVFLKVAIVLRRGDGRRQRECCRWRRRRAALVRVRLGWLDRACARLELNVVNGDVASVTGPANALEDEVVSDSELPRDWDLREEPLIPLLTRERPDENLRRVSRARLPQNIQRADLRAKHVVPERQASPSGRHRVEELAEQPSLVAWSPRRRGLDVHVSTVGRARAVVGGRAGAAREGLAFALQPIEVVLSARVTPRAHTILERAIA